MRRYSGQWIWEEILYMQTMQNLHQGQRRSNQGHVKVTPRYLRQQSSDIIFGLVESVSLIVRSINISGTALKLSVI